MSNTSSSSLSMVESRLPAGFRFYPRDDELICDYLMNKFATASDHNCSAASLIQNYNYSSAFLIDVDLNKCEPWDLPEVACVGGKEWYFYSQRDRKYATGLRTNRATISGYWKATGKDRPVFRMSRHLVGMRKTLVFYRGRAPKGRKTNWVMHEFRMEGPFGPPNISSSKDDWVLCRVFHKTSEQQSTIKPNLNSPRAGIVTAHHHQTASSGCTTHSHNNCSPDYGSSSTLPPLMDSHIIFDQTDSSIQNNHKTIVTTTTNDYDDDVNDMAYINDNKDNIMYNNSQHVPCFSIFSPNLVNQVAAAATFSGQLCSTNLTGGNNNTNNVMINSTGANFHPNLVSYNLHNEYCSQTNIIPAWSSQQLSDGEILHVEAIKNI